MKGEEFQRHTIVEETKCFDDEGYFMTGDIARYKPDLKSYEILGRARWT